MDGIEIKLDKEKIEATLTKAILDSSIGDSIDKVVNEVINKGEYRQGKHRSMVEHAIYEHTLRLVQSMVVETVNEHRETIKEVVSEKLTKEVLINLTTSAWELMIDKLKFDLGK